MISKHFNKIIQLIYSITLVPIWGLGLLNIQTSNKFTIFAVFVLTLSTTHFVPVLKQRDRISKIILSIGPTFYFIASLIVIDSRLIVYSPIVWIFSILITFLFLKDAKTGITLLFAVSAVYSFIIYPASPFSTTNSQFIPNHPSHSQNLSDFSFINSEFDTIQFTKSKSIILIETWNETCAPCIKSIRELQDTLSSRIDFEHYYLYQSRANKNLPLNQIFSFKHIKKKNRILVDIENTLYDSMKLNSYPYFLIFKENGELKHYRTGYSTEYKADILKELLEGVKSYE